MDGLAALAILGSGAISTAGSLYANKKNIDFQRQVNDINWDIAAMNNATQIEMANSAHQREVADLRAAGLNPILSAGGNGSVVPSLQSARQDSAQIQNPVEGLANSAKSLAHYVSQQYNAQLDNIKAQNANINHQSDILKAEAKKAGWEAANAQVDADIKSMENELRRSALFDLLYDVRKDSDGVHRTYFNYGKYYQDYKKGLEASAALDASQFWRANAQTAMQGINSAGTLINSIRKPLLKSTPGALRNFVPNP